MNGKMSKWLAGFLGGVILLSISGCSSSLMPSPGGTATGGVNEADTTQVAPATTDTVAAPDETAGDATAADATATDATVAPEPATPEADTSEVTPSEAVTPETTTPEAAATDTLTPTAEIAPAGDVTPTAEVTATEVMTPTDTATAMAEATPEAQATESVEEEDSIAVMDTDVTSVRARAVVNVRSGPGLNYRVIGRLRARQTAVVTGISENERWYQIECPRETNASCWVTADTRLVTAQ